MILKLDIGSGIFKRLDPSWTTVDKYVDADVAADMWNLPYGDGEVDAIWSSHALEHVARAQVIPTLQEWYRVLRMGGECTIQVPDMDSAARTWLELGDPAVVNIFGAQDHEGEFHKTGWTLKGLVADLREVGFKVNEARVLWTPDYTQYSIRTESVK